MSADFLFVGGIGICGIAVLGAMIAGIVLRISKSKLNKKLANEYGKRRR